MKCQDCGHNNNPNYRFCEECGAVLQLQVVQALPEQDLICAKCCHPNNPSYRFCEECGSDLKAQAKIAESPLIDGTIACPQCGHINLPDNHYCSRCANDLYATPIPPRPTFARRAASILVSVASSLLIAAISSLVFRFAVPYVMEYFTPSQVSGITETQALQNADQYMRAEYSEYQFSQPTVQSAFDGVRKVFVVAYSRSSGSNQTTLVVLVDAQTGYTQLMESDHSQP